MAKKFSTLMLNGLQKQAQAAARAETLLVEMQLQKKLRPL